LKRLMLLIAAGSLWLFLAAVPVFADGGPHVSAINNGTGNGGATLAADSCAGCHRAHTAQGEFLLKDGGGIATCTSCHGASGLGATTDVENGIQYVLGTSPIRTGTTLGFLLAWIISKASPLPASVQPWSVVLGIGITAVVGLFFGVYPAMRAARLDPIEALRKE